MVFSEFHKTLSQASTASLNQLVAAHERLWRNADETLPTVIHIYDLVDQSIICANMPLTSMLGYTTAQIIAMGQFGTAHLIHPDDLERVSDYYQSLGTLTGDDVAVLDYRMMRADNTWGQLQSRDTLLLCSAHGVPLQALSIVQDVTQDRRTAKLEDLLSQIVQSVSDQETDKITRLSLR